MKSPKNTNLLNKLPKLMGKYKWAFIPAVAVVGAVVAYLLGNKKTKTAIKKASLPMAENLSSQSNITIAGINQGTGLVNNDTNNNPSGENQFGVLDMHELRLSVNDFVVSDLSPNTSNAYGKNYHSFYLIMDDDSSVRSTFQNVDLSSYEGQTLMIRKFVVDSNFAPNFPTFVANYWRIGRNNSDNYLLHHSQAFLQL
ncbi:hypothetical protein FHS57_005152 [Runella defluvii]|uniref:Uncharacterized protein n=1 Tax=Runella defluvii TaxID=370973 RepID=A0A7W5ZQK7_9BACT|nr:hypothetical protein [Runella defluvii]MBB3841131.1 hypothetical protein [Runella defluvii]